MVGGAPQAGTGAVAEVTDSLIGRAYSAKPILLEFDRFITSPCERCSRRHRHRVVLFQYWIDPLISRVEVSEVTKEIVGQYRMTLRRSPRGRIISRHTLTGRRDWVTV